MDCQLTRLKIEEQKIDDEISKKMEELKNLHARKAEIQALIPERSVDEKIREAVEFINKHHPNLDIDTPIGKIAAQILHNLLKGRQFKFDGNTVTVDDDFVYEFWFTGHAKSKTNIIKGFKETGKFLNSVTFEDISPSHELPQYVVLLFSNNILAVYPRDGPEVPIFGMKLIA